MKKSKIVEVFGNCYHNAGEKIGWLDPHPAIDRMGYDAYGTDGEFLGWFDSLDQAILEIHEYANA